MIKLNSILYNKLILQAEEAKERKFIKLADGKQVGAQSKQILMAIADKKDVAELVADPADVEKAINDAIRSAISKWIPELTVNNIFLKGFLDTGAVTVELNVSLPDFIEDNITVVTTTLNPDATTTR